MAFKIHTLMEDADDDDGLLYDAIEQHMRADGELAVSSANVVARAPAAWIVGDRLCSVLDIAKISLGLPEPELFKGMPPDIFDIVAGRRRELDVHHRAWDAFDRFAAKNASKSKGVGSPLSSPSISAARKA